MGLLGRLVVDVNGDPFHIQYPSGISVDSMCSTTVKLLPLKSGEVELSVKQGQVRILVVDNGAGIEATLKGTPAESVIDIGSTEESRNDTGGLYARTSRFAAAATRIRLVAKNQEGPISLVRIRD